jgi:16S rRNA (adenine1518-N6/adenine1519-N6)-dimethyltransferase
VPTPIPRTRSGLAPLLEARGLRLSKRLGQNFLVDVALADAIVADAELTDRDLVIEIGPGAGGLTQPLLATGAHVLALELDRGMVALLDEHLGDEERLTLVEGDALDGPEGLHPAVLDVLDGARDHGFERVLVVANLPYSAGTPVLARLLRRPTSPDAIVAMLQREVVDRLRAQVGGRDYGPLAVLGALRADVTVLRSVPRDVFLPKPSVDSTVFRVTPRPGSDVAVACAAADLATVAFRKRRKKLAKSLRDVASIQTIQAAGLDPNTRAERVPPEGWVRLSRLLEGRG